MTEALDILFKRSVVELRCNWDTLVELSPHLKTRDELVAYTEAVSKAAGCGADSLRRKLDAIHHFLEAGYTQEELRTMGQEKVINLYRKDRQQAMREERVYFKLSVAGKLKELLQAEQERISKLLDFKSSEQFAEWLVAQLQQATKEELKHSAGETARTT